MWKRTNTDMHLKKELKKNSHNSINDINDQLPSKTTLYSCY